jgi:hypothetical protein
VPLALLRTSALRTFTSPRSGGYLNGPYREFRDRDTMSTILPHETVSTTDEALPNLLLDYPGADIIVRSQDRYHFRVPKVFIGVDSPGDANLESSLPVVQLPERGEILHCLLTFVFPVTPLLPSTIEEIMELLSVAQKYRMETALTHIRGSMARQNSLPTLLKPALFVYALAQKYRLLPEALQAARSILKYPMTIEDLDDELYIVSGPSLYELWKYYEGVRLNLASDLTEFRKSQARGTITSLRCTELSSSQIPRWLDLYIESIGKTPDLFDYTELNIAMARHIKDKISQSSCECASIPSQTMRDFWHALVSVVDDSFERVCVIDVPSYL